MDRRPGSGALQPSYAPVRREPTPVLGINFLSAVLRGTLIQGRDNNGYLLALVPNQALELGEDLHSPVHVLMCSPRIRDGGVCDF